MCVCVCVCVRERVHVYNSCHSFKTPCQSHSWTPCQTATSEAGMDWDGWEWPGDRTIIRILTSAAHTRVLIVPAVMEVEPVVCTASDVRPQLPALHVVQDDRSGTLAKVGPMVLPCSRG